ncbi:MAG: Peptidase rhomboid domain protein [Bacteroidetes bacterium]|nr:Peptidase rhomboid domain protein [Bacteroidota bacterium]
MTRWVIRLIIANVVVYALQILRPALTDVFMFLPVAALAQPWTVLTYMFLHGDIGHLFFNMLGLFFFGPRLEDQLGLRHFLWLYFVSGLMAAALSFVFNPFIPIIGASGAVYGVMLGFAYFWPKEPIYIWGVLPVQSRVMIAVITALSLFGGFGGGGDGIAHFAHLGGFVGGYLYLKLFMHKQTAGQFRVKVMAAATRSSDLERWGKISRESLHEVNRAEFDRIQEKITAHGVTSLTQAERAFMDRFSAE